MNRIRRRIIITALIVTDKKVITLVAQLCKMKIDYILTAIAIHILRAVAWFMARVLLGLSREGLNQIYEQVRRERQLTRGAK